MFRKSWLHLNSWDGVAKITFLEGVENVERFRENVAKYSELFESKILLFVKISLIES